MNARQSFFGVVVMTLAGLFARKSTVGSGGWTVTVTPGVATS